MLSSAICCIKIERSVFVGLEEGDIEVLDFDLQKIFRLTGHLDAVWCIDVLEDLMVSGSYDGSIKL